MNVQPVSSNERARHIVNFQEALPLLSDTRAGAPDHLVGVELPEVTPLEKQRLRTYVAMIVLDLLAIAGTFGLAGLLYYGNAAAYDALVQAQLLAPLYLTIALYNGSYSVAALASFGTSLRRALKALALAGVALLLLVFLTKTGANYSRATFLVSMVTGAFGLGVARYIMHEVVRRRYGDRIENVLIVDDGGPALHIKGAWRVNARERGMHPDAADPLQLDLLGHWFAPMDRVIVTCQAHQRAKWAMVLKSQSVEGEIVDETVGRLGAVGARRDGDQGFLLVSHRPLSLRERAAKRALDLAISVPALLLLSPLLVAVAIGIRMQDGGPALFVQNRTGRGSRIFRMYKFRSMRLTREDRAGHVSASREDARITPLGRLIRATSIDELPQLLNVVRGDMSLVGPRPHALGSRAGERLFWEIDERYSQRHSLKPGLTGLAQVRGFRGATDCEEDLVNRLQSDLQYLDGWSMWRDLGILLATLRVMVHDRAF